MIAVLSRVFVRLNFWRRRSAETDAAGELPTELLGRKPLAWSKDGQTVRIKRTSTSRLAWPARDRARGQPDVQRGGSAFIDSDDAPTRLVEPEPLTMAANTLRRRVTELQIDDEATRYVGSDNASTAPVVGWLVVIDGAGRGNSLAISAGQNPIGRGRDQRLCLDFGDKTISRERHAIVAYEPVSRRFYLQAGDGRGLTYVNKDVVLASVELNGGEVITVGDTQLRFVAFCGPQFSW